MRSTCEYLGKRFIFIWNKREIYSLALWQRNLILELKLGYGIALDISFIYLHKIWGRKSLSTKLGHVQTFADKVWGKFTTLACNEHN